MHCVPNTLCLICLGYGFAGFVSDQKVCLFCVTFWSNNSVVCDIGVILGHKVALVTSDILV